MASIEFYSDYTGRFKELQTPLNAQELLELLENEYFVYDISDIIPNDRFYKIPENELTIENINALSELIDEMDNKELFTDEYIEFYQNVCNGTIDSIQCLFSALSPENLNVDNDIEDAFSYATRELDSCCIPGEYWDFMDVSAYGDHLLESNYQYWDFMENTGLVTCDGFETDFDLPNITGLIKDINAHIEKKGAFIVYDDNAFYSTYAIVETPQEAKFLCSMSSKLKYAAFHSLYEISFMFEDDFLDDLYSLLNTYAKESGLYE